jgi:hypothetical protein
LGFTDSLDESLSFQVVEQIHHRGSVNRQRRRELDLRQRPRLDERAQHSPAPRREAQRLEARRRQALGCLSADDVVATLDCLIERRSLTGQAEIVVMP